MDHAILRPPMSESRTPSPSTRLRYAFDNLMSRGTPALIGLLAGVTLASIFVWMAIVAALGLMPEGELAEQSLAQRFWYALMRAMDAGTLGGDVGGWAFLFANLAITLAGIFVLSALISVLNAGLESKLDEMRRGRSDVVESGHTIVMGWSAAIFTILEELITANENKSDACIVILAPVDKVEMEGAIRDRIADRKSTRIVCRSGSTTEPADLAMVAVDFARTILVISPEVEDADIQVIKTMLAVLHAPDRRKTAHHLVVELRDEKNAGIARMVGRGEAEVIVASDLISRITVQTCRQSGLSVVHTELLDFGGDEIYFGETDQLVGRKFGDILNVYRDSCVIGLRTHDGAVVLPEFDRRIEPGDLVIAIAADDGLVIPTLEPLALEEDAIAQPERAQPKPERTLLLGWNERGRNVVLGLDSYVAAGSAITVVAGAEHATEIGSVFGGLARTAGTLVSADTTDRTVLDSLDAASFDHIIVLGDERLTAERSDARVLVTLLHLREIGQYAGKDFAIVSEMRDVRNRRLAEATDADDFIVSDKLVSLMMCQVAENKELHGVLSDLFDPDGGEIYLKPASDFVVLDREVSFGTLVESARRRGEIAIGYRLDAWSRDPSRAYGVRVNPPKSDRVTLGVADKLIVVAES